jgi:hypothetical protein
LPLPEPDNGQSTSEQGNSDKDLNDFNSDFKKEIDKQSINREEDNNNKEGRP